MGCAVFTQRIWPYRSSAYTRSHPDEKLASFHYPVFFFSLAQCKYEALLLGNSVILPLLPQRASLRSSELPPPPK